MFQDDESRIQQGRPRASASASQVYRDLKEHPFVSIQSVVKRTGLSFNAASSGMRTLGADGHCPRNHRPGARPAILLSAVHRNPVRRHRTPLAAAHLANRAGGGYHSPTPAGGRDMTDTPKIHDMGGRPDATPIDQAEHILMDWERRIDAIPRRPGRPGAAHRGRIAPRHRKPAAGTLPCLELLPALGRSRGSLANRKGHRHPPPNWTPLWPGRTARGAPNAAATCVSPSAMR